MLCNLNCHAQTLVTADFPATWWPTLPKMIDDLWWLIRLSVQEPLVTMNKIYGLHLIDMTHDWCLDNRCPQFLDMWMSQINVMGAHHPVIRGHQSNEIANMQGWSFFTFSPSIYIYNFGEYIYIYISFILNISHNPWMMYSSFLMVAIFLHPRPSRPTCRPPRARVACLPYIGVKSRGRKWEPSRLLLVIMW